MPTRTELKAAKREVQARLDAVEADMRDLRAKVAAELAQIEARIEEDQQKARQYRNVIISLNQTLGDGGDRPKGWQAVEIVAREAIVAGNVEDRDGALTVAEIVDELEERGWAPESNRPESAVRAAIRRLRDRDPRWGLHDGRLYYHDRPLPSESDDED